MRTGQMVFVAVGGILLGTAGTLVLQTGLVHYEVTLDIRPRGAFTVPPPALQAGISDPYAGQPASQAWEPVPPSAENLPVFQPPLDDQQVAEIVSLREQIGPAATPILQPMPGTQTESTDTFEEHLRAVAGISQSEHPITDQNLQPAASQADSSLAQGLREAQLR